MCHMSFDNSSRSRSLFSIADFQAEMCNQQSLRIRNLGLVCTLPSKLLNYTSRQRYFFPDFLWTKWCTHQLKLTKVNAQAVIKNSKSLVCTTGRHAVHIKPPLLLGFDSSFGCAFWSCNLKRVGLVDFASYDEQ